MLKYTGGVTFSISIISGTCGQTGMPRPPQGGGSRSPWSNFKYFVTKWISALRRACYQYQQGLLSCFSSAIMNTHRKARISGILAALIFLVYWQCGRYLSSGDTEPAELLPISILNGNGFDFSEFFGKEESLPYQYRRINGRVVSSYSVVPGLLNLPTYILAAEAGFDLQKKRVRHRLSHITASLLSALSAALLCLVLTEMVSLRISIGVSLIYAFCTNLWSVASMSLWQHTPSLLFLNAALLCLIRGKKSLTTAAGLSLGLAVWCRPTDMCFALPYLLYVAGHQRRYLLPFCLGAAFPLALMCWYNGVYLGSLLALKDTGIHGISGFDGNFAAGLAGLLISPSRGILTGTPLFILSLAALPFLMRKDAPRLVWYTLVGSLLLLCVNSKWSIWWGGNSYGYRLLIETVPSLAVVLALSLKHNLWKGAIGKFFFTGFLILSFYIQILGVFQYPCGFHKNLAGNEKQRLWSVARSQPLMCSRKLWKRLSETSHHGF